ncbi:gliding motility lipoprotein GldD [Pontimicrobium aquaticum]|uniref:Gliding motility lipoprotein GldD n=1 Tax=Pontimicrobium aquaticum TaxID=2565367 RepID=A0A4U0F0V6_9FLAO|nr:gliding motility lipoprotein GldD [Pontimicrobium aquaticum]TJY38055.1 gliding motility lipoprotein GldD [Pontimicrobium aquaticum]
MRTVFLIFIIICCVSCGNEPIPKPKAFLRLEYPTHQYAQVKTQLPFTFEKNMFAKDISNIKVSNDNKTYGIDITYPSLKGTIYITYKEIIENNVTPYLLDAQNLTQKHSQRADEIIEQPYIDTTNKVYGMFYEVGGNAASQSQFYLTDSVNHFVTGSLYFYAKPNYDSILPAAHYLKKDIQHIMETIRWKN